MPTMVSLQERAALRDWVALNWLGYGEIVEIGAFCGGSATAILQGMEMSRRPGVLHVYDTFKFPKNEHEAAYRRIAPVPGDSFRPGFDSVMKPWAERLSVVEGDASREGWVGGDIEILHVDCSISREFHERIAAEFYPRLIHGATIIHQDYGYEKAPFIAEIMERLGPWVKRWGTVETTAYFVVQKKMLRADVERALGLAEAMAA